MASTGGTRTPLGSKRFVLVRERSSSGDSRRTSHGRLGGMGAARGPGALEQHRDISPYREATRTNSVGARSPLALDTRPRPGQAEGSSPSLVTRTSSWRHGLPRRWVEARPSRMSGPPRGCSFALRHKRHHPSPGHCQPGRLGALDPFQRPADPAGSSTRTGCLQPSSRRCSPFRRGNRWQRVPNSLTGYLHKWAEQEIRSRDRASAAGAPR